MAVILQMPKAKEVIGYAVVDKEGKFQYWNGRLTVYQDQRYAETHCSSALNESVVPVALKQTVSRVPIPE